MDGNRSQNLVTHLRSFRDSPRPAVEAERLSLSYAELIRLIDATAAALRDIGVDAGDRILVMLPNGAEHVIAVLAISSVDAVVVPYDPDAGHSRLLDIVEQAEPHFCVIGDGQAAPSAIAAIGLHIDAVHKSIQCSLVGSAPTKQPQTWQQQPLAFIRFTSGSSGHAKGVMLTCAQQLWTARALSERFGLDAAHRELVLVSIALSGGWQRVAASLYAGGCVVFTRKPLSVGDLLDDLVDTQATGFFTPPPLVRMLLASAEDRVSAALRGCNTIEIGSAAVTADELRAFVSRVPNARVYVHYGLTECSRAVILDTTTHPDRLGTVGKPVPGVQIRIVDDQGRELGSNRVGQILLRGPQLTHGYWQQPELNRQRFLDGWLATGDYGQVDEAGFLRLRGRHDDLINCGGHCFFPDEVEHTLGMPPGIEQYLIAGVDDPRGILQQVPWAFVVPVNADSWTPAEFLALARKRLPAHMVPRQVVVIRHLALTPSGKPDRRETAKLYAENLGTEVK